jgi:Ca2+-binding EF-hand superfamily protein
VEETVTVAEPSEYADTFRLIDANGDGLISATEFKQLMTALGRDFTDEAAEKAITLIDKDGDGLVDLAEFAAFLQSGE